jgi:UDP-glucuronate 4-epimerase
MPSSGVCIPRAAGSAGGAPAPVYNVGNQHPEELMVLVALLEKELGRAAMPHGDVTETFAEVGDLMRDVGFRPQTSLEDGIRDFVAWYRDYWTSPQAQPRPVFPARAGAGRPRQRP